MPRILSICTDDGLRASREALLLKTGAEVLSADFVTGMQLATEQQFDLLVIGHSLHMEEAVPLVTVFRERWPGSKILHLGALIQSERSQIPYDKSIDWMDGPEMFLRAARRLLRETASSSASMQS